MLPSNKHTRKLSFDKKFNEKVPLFCSCFLPLLVFVVDDKRQKKSKMFVEMVKLRSYDGNVTHFPPEKDERRKFDDGKNFLKVY